MQRRRALALLAAPLLLATACSDDDSGGSGGAFGSGSSFSVESALAELPSRFDTDGLTIQVGDLAAASEVVEAERPTSADDDRLIPWSMELTAYGEGSRSVFVPIAEQLGHQYLARNVEIDEELGWSIVDVDAFVEALIPPHAMLVAVGEGIDPTRVRAAEVVEVGDGVVTAGEGEDLHTHLDAITAARPLGRPLRMAPQDGRIAVGRVLADIERWADDEPDDTLADIEAYRGLAEHLDGADPYAAVIHRMSGASDPRTEMALESTDTPRLTAGYDLVGLAWSSVDGEPVITIVHRWTGESAAAEQADLLRRIFEDGRSVQSGHQLSDLVTVDDVAAEGQFTITTLSLVDDTPAIAPYQMLMSRDLPFLTPM